MNRIHASPHVRALVFPAIACAALSLLPVSVLGIASERGNAERVVYDRIERAAANPLREEKADEVLQRQQEAAEAAEKIRSLPVSEIMRIPPSEAALAADEEGQEDEVPDAHPEHPEDDTRTYLLVGLGATLLLCVAGVLLAGGKTRSK